MKGGSVFYNFGYPLSTNTELYLFGGYGKKREHPQDFTVILMVQPAFSPAQLPFTATMFMQSIRMDSSHRSIPILWISPPLLVFELNSINGILT